MAVLFEKEVIEYLGLPSIPRKEWNGSDAFSKGVAVVGLYGDREAYAVASFDTEKGQTKPNVIKTFGIEPFKEIKRIYVVPNYMETDIENADLDAESKKKAEQILQEAKEIENEGIMVDNPMDKLPEWVFDEIHSKEEAEAWLRNWQARNRQKGRIPTTEENIKLRLYAIYNELQNKTK